MKVVLFCGGLGTRLREHSDTIPKPLVSIGYRPIIWHLMKYYAHYGHKDFILCLGYKGEMIREYFLNYDECMTNDFTLSNGGKEIRLYSSDIKDWNITFVDTGMHKNIGQRLLAVKDYVKDEAVFLANYSDGLTDLDLTGYLDNFLKTDAIASFVSVKPTSSFHAVKLDEVGMVTSIGTVAASDVWINGGFFGLRQQIFDYIEEGDELVVEPFRRLIKINKLFSQRYDGFWSPMDTFKEKINFDRQFAQGHCPWQVWKKRN